MSFKTIDGRRSMQLPNMISSKSIREGKAADGVIFKVCDFIIHPDALPQCLAQPAMLDTAVLMVSRCDCFGKVSCTAFNIAMNTLQQQFLRAVQQVRPDAVAVCLSPV